MKLGWIFLLRGSFLLSLSSATHASVSDWQTSVSSRPSLLHHYSFDGTTDAERTSDLRGTADLTLRVFGSGRPDQLQWGVAGFDASSEAVQTYRGPGTDNAEGAYLRTDSITLGNAISFEVIFSPSEPEITGGQWNLGYILSTRSGNDRGYFLTQGGPLPSSGRRIKSTIGNSHSDANTATLLESFTPGHWYYLAGSYITRGGSTTWTNYVADLTLGQTDLTTVGPFTNSGGTYPLVPTPLGIGGRWDAQEAFSGLFDEVAFYDQDLPSSVFQRHLSLLVGAQINLELKADEDDLVLSWRSKPGKRYNLRSSTDLSGDPTTWPVFANLENLTATPDKNTLTIDLPLDPQRYFVIEEFQPPPVTYYLTGFEEGSEGWTSLINDQQAATTWELGTPSASTGPLTGANDSEYAWSTNLGDYGPNSNISLRSPIIDLSSATDAELSFKVYRDADGLGDTAAVRFLRASDLLLLSDEVPIEMDVFDSGWTTIRIPLPPDSAGTAIIIEWNFISDDTLDAFSGLSLDDVIVSD